MLLLARSGVADAQSLRRSRRPQLGVGAPNPTGCQVTKAPLGHPNAYCERKITSAAGAIFCSRTPVLWQGQMVYTAPDGNKRFQVDDYK